MEEIHGGEMSSVTLSSVLLLLLFGRAANAQRGLEFFDLLPEDPKLYDKMRPPKKDGQPTVVYFHVTVMGLDSIDENSMTYAADIFFAQTWKDNRLRLPENMTSEYRLLEVDWLKNMWRPDSFFKNAKSVTFQTMTIPNHYLWLYKDKTILYMVKLTLKLSCAMNFLIYPHDTQECKLQMESLSHTTDEMIFQWDPDVPLVVDENIELPQLQLVKNYTADCTQVYSTVGVILDKTRGRASQSYPGSHLATHPVHATRQKSSLLTARLVFEGCRRLYVGLHGVRLYGTNGVLSGEHCPRRLGYTCSETCTTATATAAILEHRRFGQVRQNLRHRCQGKRNVDILPIAEIISWPTTRTHPGPKSANTSAEH
ncbi:glycine receptor ora transientless isoform X5 [Anoplolepis gracilipes]|uniref:glycine receptor ora transientless isoform X5 n=1 Tax=Anoplolepis gracilipes TaxID=354296 RepID=UPI003B9F6092